MMTISTQYRTLFSYIQCGSVLKKLLIPTNSFKIQRWRSMKISKNICSYSLTPVGMLDCNVPFTWMDIGPFKYFNEWINVAYWQHREWWLLPLHSYVWKRYYNLRKSINPKTSRSIPCDPDGKMLVCCFYFLISIQIFQRALTKNPLRNLVNHP